MNLESRAFDSGFGADVGQCFKDSDEFRPAIGIPAIINGIRANENVTGANRFRPSHRVREKNCISCRNVSYGNAGTDLLVRTPLWKIAIIAQRGTAKDLVVNLGHYMFFRAKRLRYFFCSSKLALVTLAVVE